VNGLRDMITNKRRLLKVYKWQREFMKYLKLYNSKLTKQQYKTLKGQALSGQKKACRKGLVTILNRNNIKVSLGRW